MNMLCTIHKIARWTRSVHLIIIRRAWTLSVHHICVYTQIYNLYVNQCYFEMIIIYIPVQLKMHKLGTSYHIYMNHQLEITHHNHHKQVLTACYDISEIKY